MPKHVAWRLQAQIGIRVPEGLTAGVDESGYDLGKEGKTWGTALSTQGEIRWAKSHLEESQERWEDKIEVVYLWECLKQNIWGPRGPYGMKEAVTLHDYIASQ